MLLLAAPPTQAEIASMTDEERAVLIEVRNLRKQEQHQMLVYALREAIAGSPLGI
ncbi:MAG: hypothetical protein AAGB51_06260 [Planctomycetota bacterium]